MHFHGLDLISQLTTHDHYQAKMVFNAHGAIFFPATQEHRDQSGPNISYADNYKGNALAAMISPGKIEVRYHQGFTDDQVSKILSDLLKHPDLACLIPCKATYQGRAIQTSVK